MSDIWYLYDGRTQRGPLKLDELKSALAGHQTAGEWLVWRDGFPEWKRSADVPELWANEREVVGETFVHPWRRFFARHLDLVLMAFALGMINGAVFEENSPAGRLLNNGGVMMLLAIVLFVPVEAILLATWGSTTGKALYGIRIKRDDAGALSFGEALSRSFDVSARGLGFGLPLVSWVTLFLGYKTLRDTKKTSWDSRLELSVRHARIGVGRAIAIGAVWAGILALMALGIYATDSGF